MYAACVTRWLCMPTRMRIRCIKVHAAGPHLCVGSGSQRLQTAVLWAIELRLILWKITIHREHPSARGVLSIDLHGLSAIPSRRGFGLASPVSCAIPGFGHGLVLRAHDRCGSTCDRFEKQQQIIRVEYIACKLFLQSVTTQHTPSTARALARERNWCMRSRNESAESVLELNSSLGIAL